VRALADPEAKRRIGLAWRASSPRKAEMQALAAVIAAGMARL